MRWRVSEVCYLVASSVPSDHGRDPYHLSDRLGNSDGTSSRPVRDEIRFVYLNLLGSWQLPDIQQPETKRLKRDTQGRSCAIKIDTSW